MTSYPLEINRIAITTDGKNAVADYRSGEALLFLQCFALDPSNHSETALVAAALEARPASAKTGEAVEIVISRDDGGTVTTTSKLIQSSTLNQGN